MIFQSLASGSDERRRWGGASSSCRRVPLECPLQHKWLESKAAHEKSWYGQFGPIKGASGLACLINPFHWVSLKEVLQRVIGSLAFVYSSGVLRTLAPLLRRDCVPNVKTSVYVNVPANFHSVSSHRSKPNRGPPAVSEIS